MKFLLNEKHEAQCPECGKFVKFEFNNEMKQYEFECCRRKYCLFISQEEVEKITEIEISNIEETDNELEEEEIIEE